MDTLNLLKEEINQTTQSEHDLAKWKLIVTAGLGGAALGLGKDTPHYWLLLCVPFVCAYIDLHAYQYQTRIMVIARFIREKGKEDAALQAYEHLCDKYRQKKVFYLGQYANLSASIILSVLAGVLAVAPSLGPINKPNRSTYLAICLWVTGLGLIIVLWWWHRRVIKKVEEA